MKALEGIKGIGGLKSKTRSRPPGHSKELRMVTHQHEVGRQTPAKKKGYVMLGVLASELRHSIQLHVTQLIQPVGQ